jgi:hypothetical protein
VADLLSDDAIAVAQARNATFPDDPRVPAGASLTERLENIERHLAEAPEREHVIVWFRYRAAAIGYEPVLKLGDDVSLYSEKELEAALERGDDDLPEETRADVLGGLVHVIERQRSDEEASQVRKRIEDEYSVLIRIDLGSVLVHEAVRVGRRTAEAVAAVASLFGVAPSLFQVDAFASYVADGRGGWRGGPARGRGVKTLGLTVEECMDLEHPDRIVSSLASVGRVIGPHLPLCEDRLADVCTLAGWLREARRAPAPARLLLCDRVIEQVAGWAGVDSTRSFIREHLGPGWAYEQIIRELRAVAWDVHLTLMQTGTAAPSGLRRIIPETSGVGFRVNFKAVLEELTTVLNELPAGSDGHRRAQELEHRCRNGMATNQWWERLHREFRMRNSRARRTRNAITHGGPLLEPTVEAVVDFVDDIAAVALHVALQGCADGVDLIDHFLARKANLDRSRERLRAGEPASEALFWADEEA